jgi:hypothetical protein
MYCHLERKGRKVNSWRKKRNLIDDLNDSLNKVQIPLVGCNGPLSASFDKHIDFVRAGFSSIMRFKIYDLNLGHSMNVSTKDNLLEY